MNKKLISILTLIFIIISACMLFPASSFAAYTWDLTEKPDFTDYYLNIYGHAYGEKGNLWAVSETELDKAEVEKITSDILHIVNSVEFVPVSNPDYAETDMMVFLHFTKETYATDLSDTINITLTKTGMCMDVWDRVNHKEHYAFVYCDGQSIADRIYALLKDVDEKVAYDREQKELESYNERSKYQTEVTNIKKLYSAVARNIEMKRDEAIIHPAYYEMGILSYETVADGKTHYSFYCLWKDGGGKDTYFSIAENIGENNIISFNTYISKDSYDGKYYLNTSTKDNASFTTELIIGEDGLLSGLVTSTNMGYKGEIDSKQITQSGVLQNYGDLKIMFDKPDISEDKKDESSEIDEKQPETEEPKQEAPSADETEEKKEDTIIKEEEKNDDKKEPVTEEATKLPEDKQETIDDEDAVTEDKTSSSQDSYADVLYSLGLFKGTEKGYELEKTFTREEAATILVRLLGEEQNLNAQRYNVVFEDVPYDRWSFPYVMYCYENAITKGTGYNTFSPEKPITAEEFVTLVLRLMNYKDAEPENALDKAMDIGLLNSSDVQKFKAVKDFIREDMVFVVYKSLITKTEGGDTLANILTQKNVITEDDAKQLNMSVSEK